MLASLIAHLKTGTIPNVVAYGVAQLPSAPYIVVKPETDSVGRGERFRLIVHMQPGQQVILRTFTRITLFNLVNNVVLTTATGKKNKLKVLEFNPAIVTNDDNTISMERLVLAPGIL